MDYLSRGSAPFSDELWGKIDEAVITSARRVLVGRRFLNLYGPLGPTVPGVFIDDLRVKKEDEEDGEIATSSARKYKELPIIKADFTLSWRDLELAGGVYPVDLSAAHEAATKAAAAEDRLIFFGSEKLGIDGLLTVKGSARMKRGDWSVGENAFADVSQAVLALTDAGFTGRLALIVSPNLYAAMQRLQPGTGRLESERVADLVGGRLYTTPVLGRDRAVLVVSEPYTMDLAVGVDFSVAYLELKDLNHVLRVMETALPRIKRPDAVVVFE